MATATAHPLTVPGSTAGSLTARPPDPVLEHAPLGSDGRIDWSPWYLTDEDDMGQGAEQCKIIEVLCSSLEQLIEEWSPDEDERPGDSPGGSKLRDAASGQRFVGFDQFFAWVKDHPNVRVSPDVYLLDHAPGPPYPSMWETWRPDHQPPRFAVEVVSTDWQKDYTINPSKYAHLRARELVIIDPEVVPGVVAEVSEYGSVHPGESRQAGHPAPTNGAVHAHARVPIQVFRRDDGSGFARVYAGPGPAYCEQIDAYILFARQADGAVRARIGRDPAGRSIVPTSAERADIERRRADDERRRADDERRRADIERRRADDERRRAERAEARLRALEKTLRTRADDA